MSISNTEDSVLTLEESVVSLAELYRSQSSALEEQLAAVLTTGANFKERLIYLTGEVDSNTSSRFIAAVNIMDSVPGTIRVFVNSLGGEERSGFAIYDVLKACSNRIEIYGAGGVYSIAALIFQAGNHRALFPEARVLIHNGSIEMAGAIDVDQIGRVAQETNQVSRRYAALIAERSARPAEQIIKLCDQETFFTAEEAVKLGLADSIVTKIPPVGTDLKDKKKRKTK